MSLKSIFKGVAETIKALLLLPIKLFVLLPMSLFGFRVSSEKGRRAAEEHYRLDERNKTLTECTKRITLSMTSLREVTHDMIGDVELVDEEEKAFCFNVFSSLTSFPSEMIMFGNHGFGGRYRFHISKDLENRMLAKGLTHMSVPISRELISSARSGCWEDALLIVEMIMARHYYPASSKAA